MKKNLFLIPCAVVGLFAAFGNNVNKVSAKSFEGDFEVQNTVIEEIHYDCDTENKKISAKKEYIRNDDLSINAEIYYGYDYQTQSMELEQKAEYSYDSNGNTTKIKNFTYSNPSWIFDDQTTYQFNSDNQVTLESYYGDDENTITQETTYTYENKLLVKEVNENISATRHKTSQIDYVYDSNNNLTKKTVSNFNSNDELTGGYVCAYTYNAEGKEETYEYKNYNGSSFLTNPDATPSNRYKQEYSYTDNTEITYKLNWNTSRSEYYYDTKIVEIETSTDSQNVYEEIWYEYNEDDSSWDFYESYKYTIYYTEGKMVRYTTESKEAEDDEYVLSFETEYKHMIIEEAPKSSILPLILGIIGGVILLAIIAFVVLFFIWKKEFDKVGEAGERKLVKLDPVYKKINNLLFNKTAKNK